VVEALATGLPVVAADSGGVTEILGDDPDALGGLVPRDDHVALAAGILRTLERIDLFDPARLRSAVVGRFDDATVARRLTALYREVLDGPAAATAAGDATAAADATPSLEARPMASSAPRAPQRRRILVAIDPARAAQASRIGESVRAGLVLVTSTGLPEAARSGFGGIVETDLQGRVRALADAAALGPPATGLRRILRAIQHPLAVARRRGWLPGLERLVDRRGTGAIRSAIALADPAASEPVEIVCLDGLDHLAAAQVIGAGEGRLAHAGLRRLGDEA
jgi:hypothetical protein